MINIYLLFFLIYFSLNYIVLHLCVHQFSKSNHSINFNVLIIEWTLYYFINKLISSIIKNILLNIININKRNLFINYKKHYLLEILIYLFAFNF